MIRLGRAFRHSNGERTHRVLGTPDHVRAVVVVSSTGVLEVTVRVLGRPGHVRRLTGDRHAAAAFLRDMLRIVG